MAKKVEKDGADTTEPLRTGHRFLWSYLVIILMALVGGGIYAWQHQKVTDLNAKLAKLESRQQKADIAAMTPVVLTSTETRDQKAVQLRLQEFFNQYSSVDITAKKSKQLETTYLSQKALDYIHNPRGFSAHPLFCNQYRTGFVVGRPSVQKDSASVVITPIFINSKQSQAEEPIHYTLVKQSDEWLIDTATCAYKISR